MITIFSSPRPFAGIFDAIQKNAIKSWMALGPGCQIILFEDEEKTTGKIAEEFGLECVTDAKRNEFGSLLMDSMFERARAMAKNDIIIRMAADMLLGSSFIKGMKQVKEIFGEKPFLAIGRRWDADIEGEIDVKDNNFDEYIKKIIKEKGILHGLSGMDYWAFHKDADFFPPSLVAGRPGDDGWMVYNAKTKKIPIIDATAVIDIVHQNHYHQNKAKDFFETEVKRNVELTGGLKNMMGMREADWILTERGLKRPPFLRRFQSVMHSFYPWRVVLALKRKLRNFLKERYKN